ncbi:hypothetical protein [Niabella hibiscisoli]|uniref:hypothetical protein n=1 Tax=Niabella hibiscisoli TaxID=1825928 RepID=UPI001F0D24A4|nr:hypothetical protein [Niabella hibiscisoli]MCH5718298.1 hypothetical protein [Niabella hibiscisoli]
MMLLNVHAGGHSNYLEMLKTKLEKLFDKINRNPDLSPSEKFEARQEALNSIKKDKKKALKTVINSGFSPKRICLKVSA